MFIPLITRNHIYQGVALGGDTKTTFLPLIERATNGDSLLELAKDSLYPSLGISMWVLGVTNRAVHLNPEVLFYLYSLVVLFGVGVTLYYLGEMAGGYKVGWIMLALGLLCTTSILALYSYACLASILNVYIILMWAIISFSRWHTTRRILYLALGLILIALYSGLHPTSFYIPYVMGMLAILLFALLGLRKINLKNIGIYLGIIITVIIINLTMSHLLMDRQLTVLTSYVDAGVQNIIPSSQEVIVDTTTLPSPQEPDITKPSYPSPLQIIWANLRDTSGTFVQYLTPVTIVIGIFVAMGTYKARLWRYIKNWCPLILLSCFAITLIGGSYIRATYLPERIILDASAMIAFIMAILLGELIKRKNLLWLKISSYVLMGFGTIQSLIRWVV